MLATIISSEWVILLCLATLLAFTVASTLGIGGPLILLPILMLKFSPAESIAMIVPAMFVNNIGRLGIFYSHLQLKPALLMLTTALPFATIMAFFTGIIHPAILKGLIIFVIAYMLMSRYVFSIQFKIKRGGLIFWGIPTGAISGLSGTAGPPMAIAMHGYGLVLEQFVATTALVQAGLQIVRLPVYLSTELLTTSHWMLAFIMAASSIPSVFFSRIILKRLKPASFRIALDVLLGIIGLVLLISVILSSF